MTSENYRLFHLAALLVLGISAIPNWRIYLKYRTLYGQDVTALGQIKRLIAEGNRDGYVALWASVIAVVAGLILIVMPFLHR